MPPEAGLRRISIGGRRHSSSRPRLASTIPDTHDDARMHLGGIGTGNFEIGADGQLTTWQLFNTLRDGTVPFCFLARVGKVTRLLQTRGGPDWPRVKQISMTGEYPLATLRFSDPELPARIEMTAFTPFAPLDTRLSSIPAAVFLFRIHNPTDKPLEVSLAALMMNPVGYDAAGPIEGHAHPNFGGNVNEAFRDAGTTGLVMKAEAGRDPAIDGKVSITTLSNLARPGRTAARLAGGAPRRRARSASADRTSSWTIRHAR